MTVADEHILLGVFVLNDTAPTMTLSRCHFVVMVSVTMLIVVMLDVVVPSRKHLNASDYLFSLFLKKFRARIHKITCDLLNVVICLGGLAATVIRLALCSGQPALRRSHSSASSSWVNGTKFCFAQTKF